MAVEVFTPFQQAMAQKMDSNLRALPDLQQIAENPVNNKVIWQASDGEKKLLPLDKQVITMIKGAIGGMYNELAFPYETDPVTGASERIFDAKGKELAEEIVFQRKK